MLFTTREFAVFLLSVLVLYSLVPKRLRPVVLLLASYYFYADASVAHLAILISDTVIAFYVGRAVARSGSRIVLWVGIVGIVTPLIALKYSSFIGTLAGHTNSALSIGNLPIGISFYTFQAISYIVDIYRRRAPQTERIGHCALYLAFFPQLLAGPIERTSALTPQLQTLDKLAPDNLYAGAKLLLWGLFCKLILADKAGLILASVFASPFEQPKTLLVSGLYLYSFQIYFDFLGYVLMATGMARMFGVRLTRNFAQPYLATSLREFWRRWHITLMTWFRDYVYAPLGGNRRGAWRYVVSVVVVFLLSGLWHGASVNFLLWGAGHGALFLVSEGVRRRGARHVPRMVWVMFAWVLTISVVSLMWGVFIRDTYPVIDALLGHPETNEVARGVMGSELDQVFLALYLFFLALFFGLDSLKVMERFVEPPKGGSGVLLEIGLANAMALLLILFGDYGASPFIYFRF